MSRKYVYFDEQQKEIVYYELSLLGKCDKCGADAHYRCDNCKKLFCEEHFEGTEFNSGRELCEDCCYDEVTII